MCAVTPARLNSFADSNGLEQVGQGVFMNGMGLVTKENDNVNKGNDGQKRQELSD